MSKMPRSGMPPKDALHEAQRAEELEKWRLPLMFGGFLALILMSRFDATRALGARLFTFGFPIVGAGVGAIRYRDSHAALRALAIVAAVLAAVAAEVALGRALLPDSPLLSLVPENLPLVWIAWFAVLLGGIAQALAQSRGLRSFLAAWLGMVAVWGMYVPDHHVGGHDAMDAMLGAAIVSMFAGGGAGLILGFLASRFSKRPETKT
jgi:hypothetical protein